MTLEIIYPNFPEEEMQAGRAGWWPIIQAQVRHYLKLVIFTLYFLSLYTWWPILILMNIWYCNLIISPLEQFNSWLTQNKWFCKLHSHQCLKEAYIFFFEVLKEVSAQVFASSWFWLLLTEKALYIGIISTEI